MNIVQAPNKTVRVGLPAAVSTDGHHRKTVGGRVVRTLCPQRCSLNAARMMRHRVERMVAVCFGRQRKVRAPQGRVVGNADRSRD